MFTDNDDDAGTIFRDVITLALIGFVVMVVLLLPHINPVGKLEDSLAPPPGQVIVEIRWPDDVDVDIDLWVQAPGDRPVGYSNKGGLFFNLLRDDLGTLNDNLGLNYENSYSRGIVAGEYTVNVHHYRGSRPVTVTVQVSVQHPNGRRVIPLLTREVVLAGLGEEKTAFRFTLKANGAIQPGSVHGLFKPLRTRRDP